MSKRLADFSAKMAHYAGHWVTFIIAVAVVILWAVSGPVFKFSDTWQLLINTATTISTGLMVFLIQNTQNRDAQAIHLKLDELLRAMPDARNEMINAEEDTEEELEALKRQYAQLQRSHDELKDKLATGAASDSRSDR